MTETTAPAKAGTPNLNKALSQLQGELPRIKKTKTAEVKDQQGNRVLYKYDYADLGDVVADIGPLMAKYGLAFHCGPTINPADRREMILIWSLLHESGEEKAGEWPLGPVSQKPQSLGSAITYGRRYCFTAATNIVLEDDDDGQRAQQDHGHRQSAGDVWENARPRPGNQEPRAAKPEAAKPEAADPDAQTFADKAHKARNPADIEAIHREAREAGKVTLPVRNPSSGGVGKLAVYLDWRRKQLENAVRLDPDDEWAQTVADIKEPADADRVITDATDQLGREVMSPEHYARISNAVDARLAEITPEKAA